MLSPSPRRRETGCLSRATSPDVERHIRIIHSLREFVAFESAGGILLAIAAAVTLTLANSPLAFLYGAFLETPIELHIGALQTGAVYFRYACVALNL